MELFWQFFATGVFSLLVGIQIGRSAAISQILIQQQQAGQQQGLSPQLMAQMFQRPGVSPPPGNGPA